MRSRLCEEFYFFLLRSSFQWHIYGIESSLWIIIDRRLINPSIVFNFKLGELVQNRHYKLISRGNFQLLLHEIWTSGRHRERWNSFMSEIECNFLHVHFCVVQVQNILFTPLQLLSKHLISDCTALRFIRIAKFLHIKFNKLPQFEKTRKPVSGNCTIPLYIWCFCRCQLYTLWMNVLTCWNKRFRERIQCGPRNDNRSYLNMCSDWCVGGQRIYEWNNTKVT